MTEERLCPRCGSPMIEVDRDEFYDKEGYKCYCYECSDCGMAFDAEVPIENEIKHQDINNQGFGKCPFCGGWLAWSSDFMLSDFEGGEPPEEEDTLVQTLNCPKCGAYLTAYYPREEE